MLKIAISGGAGSGKNTAASIICDKIVNLKKDEYKISAFANKIKQILSIMFPDCDSNSLYGPSERRQDLIKSSLNEFIETDVSFRQVTIDIGKLGRKYNSYFWVAHIAMELSHLPYSDNNIKLYIASDFRFKEELYWLKANGFMLCRIKRDNLIKIDDISETIQNEIPDSEFDIIIDNNGSKDELEQKLKIKLDSYFSNNMTYLQITNG